MIEILSLIFAGLLTTVSPCVLPVLPFIMASSLSKSKWGPIILCSGLIFTFVLATLVISRSGAFFGIEPNYLKKVAAIMIIAGGSLFILPKLQEYLASFLTKMIPQSKNFPKSNLKTEFIAGLTLGVLWTPCSGPSLGVALGFAAQSQTFWQALLYLTVFALASSLPLLLIAYGSRNIFISLRKNSKRLEQIKKWFGFFIILWGLIIFTNTHYQIEIFLTELMPESWIKFLLKF